MQQFLALILVALVGSAVAQSFQPETGQQAAYQPIRQAYQSEGPGDKLITVADLDGAFVETVEVSANVEGLRTIRITFQRENNTPGTLIYTERTGGELANTPNTCLLYTSPSPRDS